MKLGVCCGVDTEKMKYLKVLGYDYAESNCQEIVKASDEKTEEMKNCGLPILAANCFIALRVVGEERDFNAIDEYLEKLFSRAKYLGLKCLVFGSSGARRIPEGMTLEEGRAQIAEFLKYHVAPVAEKYDIPVAIEPLRPAECNAINTVANGVELAERVASPYIKVLADVKHMYEQGEDFNLLRELKGMIIHAHTSMPNPDSSLGKNRIYPKENDGFNQAAFLDPLNAIGVESCSIEADVIDFEKDAREAFEVLRKFK